jgi:hypothetical protein
MLMAALALLAGGSVAAGQPVASGAEQPPAPAGGQSAAAPALFLSDKDLLLYSVDLDQLTLTETLTAYGDPSDPLLPVGELARLLDLDLDVSPADRRITGTLGEARQTVTIDLKSGVARVGGNNVALAQADLGFTHNDIYIRASVLQHILPVRFDVSAEALEIRLTALEKLPIQERLERIAKLRGLGQNVDAGEEPALRIRSPYRLFTPPSFDVAVEGGRDTRTLHSYSGRYDVRFAGDLLYTNMQGYVGSDDRGRVNSARLLFERRSAEGALPLGATRISGGDVFTPALAIGPRSVGGRGFSFSTAPVEEASVFNTIDLRGELPIGYDVELYINDVLRSGQRTPVQGRYEFLNVPLVRGINVIRIVTYGPRGERNETVRIINVGGGQLRKHATEFEFGVVDEGRTLIQPQPLAGDDLTLGGATGLRAVASAAYGLTDALTLVGGAAVYPVLGADRRNLATVGVRTSLIGFAVQADAAADSKGGAGLALGLAGQPFGVSMVFRHAEYRGGFLDETISAADPEDPPVSHTALTVDFALPPIGGKRIPLSLRALVDSFANGERQWTGSARGSVTLAGTLLSTGFDYQRSTTPNSVTVERLSGNFAASKFLNFKWQLRASADYDLLPKAVLRALSFTADRSVSQRLALRFGLGESLGKDGDTFAQAGSVFRLPFGELALSGDYSVRNGDWSVSVRFGFGSLFNPVTHRYVMTAPGPASGGSAVVQAFVDRDGDGRFGPGDEPVPRVLFEGGDKRAVSDARGQAVVTNLGTAPTGSIEADIKNIDETFVSAPPSRIEFAPRPGKVIRIPYPITPVGEVYARLMLKRPGEPPVGLSAVQVRLVRPGHDPILGTSEYDGSVVFSDIPLGTYSLELDPAQAKRLGMKFGAPVTVSVTAEKDAEVQATVEFTNADSSAPDPGAHDDQH